MDEAERLADDLVIIDHGKIIASGTPHSIIDSLGAEGVIEFALDSPDGGPDYASLPGVVSVRRAGSLTELTVRDSSRALPALLDRVRSAGREVATLHIHRPTLEDVFVTLTGRHLRDE